MKGVAIAAAAASLVAIGLVQPDLAKNVHSVKQREDVFLLPPPKELQASTMGFRAAATDLLWAKLILEYGLHWQEKRAFPDVTRYIDGVLALEPDFPTLYGFVDTILVYPPGRIADENDARLARHYLEQGTRARPYDPEVWSHYGQFIAFLAPSYLHDDNEIQRWRVDGAMALARAVELGADPSRSLAAVSILDKANDRDATIRALQRSYAVTENPELREQYLLRLKKLKATAEAEESVSAVERERRAHTFFLSYGESLLVGPHRSATKCAGPASFGKKGCPRDWTEVVENAK